MIAQHITSPHAAPPAALLQSPALRSLQILDEIEQHWEGMLEELREHIPRLRSQRAFYDGAWVLGLRVGGRTLDDAENATLPFSRLDIQIKLDKARENAALTSCITVRNRDEPRQSLETRLDDAGYKALRDFLENAAFTFVDRYFDRS